MSHRSDESNADKARARARQARKEPGWTAARRAEVLRLRQAGKTLQEIGNILGVGRERARQIVFRAKIEPGQQGTPHLPRQPVEPTRHEAAELGKAGKQPRPAVRDTQATPDAAVTSAAGRRKPTDADLAVGRRLRRLRLAAGLTQAEIADALGVSYQQASKYEIGETRMSSAMVLRLCKVLGCDPNTLFGWRDRMPSDQATEGNIQPRQQHPRVRVSA